VRSGCDATWTVWTLLLVSSSPVDAAHASVPASGGSDPGFSTQPLVADYMPEIGSNGFPTGNKSAKAASLVARRDREQPEKH
jgi:hypothetical protein